MNMQIVNALQQIKADYGVDIFADARRVKGLLADSLQNEHKGERGLLLQVLDLEAVKRMRRGNTFSEVELRSHAAYFATEYLRPEDVVLSALQCWQKVFSRYEPQKPPTPIQKKTVEKQPTGQVQPQKPGTNSLGSLRKRADQGDAEAQFNLGLWYRDGRSVAHDDSQAVAWWRKAANQGYAEAQFSLGLMYKNGRGVAQDDRQAVAWFQKAAAQGHTWAQHSLGRMYKNSLGTPSKTNAQAVSIPIQQQPTGQVQPQGAGNRPLETLRVRAEQGDAKAQSDLGAIYYEVGQMYYVGQDVTRDVGQAMEWFQKAANQGYADAQYSLGLMYASRGVAQDDRQAVAWFQKAADQGHAKAQYCLGMAYANGLGVTRRDYTQAVAWLQKAAIQGLANAQSELHRIKKRHKTWWGRILQRIDKRRPTWV